MEVCNDFCTLSRWQARQMSLTDRCCWLWDSAGGKPSRKLRVAEKEASLELPQWAGVILVQNSAGSGPAADATRVTVAILHSLSIEMIAGRSNPLDHSFIHSIWVRIHSILSVDTHTRLVGFLLVQPARFYLFLSTRMSFQYAESCQTFLGIYAISSQHFLITKLLMQRTA